MPLAFAHRGGMATAPENSLPAFRAALAHGAVALESDIWVAPGGRPVLSHGRPRGPVVGLDELFAACGTGFDLSLDVPNAAAAAAVLAVARSAGHDLRRLWLCGATGLLPAWRELDPDVRLVGDARWTSTLPGRTGHLARLAAVAADALNLRCSRWSAGLVRRTHDAGLLAFAWDIQTAARRDRVLALGCDGLYSDHLDLLLPGPVGEQ